MVGVASHLTRFAVNSNHAICHAYKHKELGDDPTQFLAGKSKYFRGFFWFRHWYFLHMEAERGRWEFLDKEISLFEQRLIKVESEKCDESPAPMSMDKMLRRWFPFDIYLVTNYRHKLDDMIEMKWTTWILIMVLLLVQAQIHRAAGKGAPVFTKKDTGFDFVVWLILAQIVILVISIWIFIQYRRVSRQPAPQQVLGKRFTGLHHIHPALWVARVLQLCLFFTMYEFARVIANKSEWENDADGYTKPLVYVFVLIFAMIPEGLLLGLAMPIFSSLLATGYWMQRSHVRRLFAICMAHCEGEGKFLRQMGDNVEMFDDEAKEMLQERKEKVAEKAAARAAGEESPGAAGEDQETRC